MPCGKRPLVKNWDKPKRIRMITPSRYEQTLDSVKVHWQNVIKELEMSYKDEQFWETNCDTVRELVGPVIFQRIAKIFDLPEETSQYQPKDQFGTPSKSEDFYVKKMAWKAGVSILGEGEPLVEEEEAAQLVEESDWTESTVNHSDEKRTMQTSKTIHVSKSLSKMLSKSFSRFMSKVMAKPVSDKLSERVSAFTLPDSLAATDDDLNVRPGSAIEEMYHHHRRGPNPYFDMLYCTESETDMIKWKSKYKQKTFEVSASDEFSKRAEILAKKISNEFFDWWVSLGNVEFKSEIKRPEDIEALFQVWFDQHASRGLVLNPQIMPCVLRSIATSTGVQRACCLKALKRQIADDIKAETSPAHTMAFGKSLPHKLKHLPPQNNTRKMWRGVIIPEDLRTMSCVWEDIQHLTSTKAFQHWLMKHPQLPMPPFLKDIGSVADKKTPFVVPSDFVMKDKATLAPSTQELALPVSQFSLELKEVLSRLMNQ
ncbi:uncharacterized protein LOC111358611 isoform X1 [Spodoptera litura]|uniref:Uncharacterized protein LOC111358611 isoform X1 n=1 Tax=Spodoptera litura TaxID=69820 RepID=A0A9J7EEK7_SPOLT|nr:uncharacterized protein LOC111358611 isoform X1 [Spodoptera litura]